MNKNRIEGVAELGERAMHRKALVTKFRWRRSGGRAVKECVLTWGDLASCLKGQRCKSEREVSRGRSSTPRGARRAEREGVESGMTMRRVMRQMSAPASGPVRGRVKPCLYRAVTKP